MTQTYLHPDSIVDGVWLEAHLDDPSLRIYECTTYLDPPQAGEQAPYTVRNAQPEFDAGHIPGAKLIDLQQDLSDPSYPRNLRFMMPAPQALGSAFAKLGVSDDTRVVLYSRGGSSWATRVWWMLRSIGFDNAAVLDGGYDRWTLDGRSVSREAGQHSLGGLTVRARDGMFVDRMAVQGAIGDSNTCTINALSPELHRGEDPRYGRPGRIPGSVNLPATSLLNTHDKTFLPAAEVSQAFQDIGADTNAKTVIYCGGGIAASLDAFLMYQLGYKDVAIYDASMSEWARDESLPVEIG